MNRASLVAQLIESTCNVRNLGLIPGSGRSAGEGEWLPTSIFLPGEFHGQRTLASYSPWGHKESLIPLSKKICDKPRQHIKKQRHFCANKSSSSQSYDFSSSHVWMWEFNHRGGWEPKNWYFGIVVLQMTLETARRSNQSILKEINPEHTLEGQLVAAILWPPDAKNPLISLMLGKTECNRRSRWQRMRWLDSIPNSVLMNLS